MTKEQVVKLVGQGAVKDSDVYGDDVLEVATAPDPHPDFEDYLLVISPKQGLLKIIASGKKVRTTRYGDDLHDLFLETTAALVNIYGPVTNTFDFLASDSTWDEPQDWMMGLVKGERRLISFWVFKTTPRPKHICGITLEAHALSMEKGFLTLRYEFEGSLEYDAAKKAKTGRVL
jgi:hypothetical protein